MSNQEKDKIKVLEDLVRQQLEQNKNIQQLQKQTLLKVSNLENQVQILSKQLHQLQAKKENHRFISEISQNKQSTPQSKRNPEILSFLQQNCFFRKFSDKFLNQLTLYITESSLTPNIEYMNDNLEMIYMLKQGKLTKQFLTPLHDLYQETYTIQQGEIIHSNRIFGQHSKYQVQFQDSEYLNDNQFVIYGINVTQFRFILSQFKAEYELFFELRDQFYDKLFIVETCKKCNKNDHSLEECPEIVFMREKLIQQVHQKLCLDKQQVQEKREKINRQRQKKSVQKDRKKLENCQLKFCSDNNIQNSHNSESDNESFESPQNQTKKCDLKNDTNNNFSSESIEEHYLKFQKFSNLNSTDFIQNDGIDKICDFQNYKPEFNADKVTKIINQKHK